MLISGSVLTFPCTSRWQILFAKTRFWPLALGLLLLFPLKSDAWAQTTINVPKDQPTIQAGINAAKSGDTVLVAPGTYRENIDFKGKAITVISSACAPALSPGCASSTIIDGGGGPYTIIFRNNEPRSSVIEGFTIQHGGKVANEQNSNGGIRISAAAPSIVGNVITSNFCYGVASYMGAPLVSNNEISSTLDSGNACSASGGAGIYLFGAYEDSGVPGNPASPEISGNIIEDNVESGTDIGGGNGGAGITDWGSSPVIENNTIRNNKTLGNGGGINIIGPDRVIIAQNLIYGNAAGCGGGGLAFDVGSEQGTGSVQHFIVNNVIAANSTGLGCGANSSQVYIWVQSNQTEFANNIVVNKGSTNSAVYCDPTWDTHVQPLNIFDHNDIFSSSGKGFDGTCADPTGTYGNIAADPLFVDAVENDYHLQAGSPAIDSGNDSALQQLENTLSGLRYDFQSIFNERRQDAAAKGHSIVDMGAYEFSGARNASATTIILTPSAYEVSGGSLALTAKLVSASGTPTGKVIFYQDHKQIGSGTLDADGSVTVPVPSLMPGAYGFVASYSESDETAAGVSVEVIVFVRATTDAGTSTSTSLNSSLNPAAHAQSVTFTAKVSSSNGIPTGTVVFSSGSTNLATVNLTKGVASYTTTSLPAGSDPITATYAGNNGFASSSGSLVETITGLVSSTSLVVTPNPTYVLSRAQLVATVAGTGATPTGTVSFSANGMILGTSAVDATGTATLPYAFPSIGAIAITASYSGDDTFSASTSVPFQENVVISPSTTTVSASPNPAFAFESATLIVRVAPGGGSSSNAVPGGTVTFYDGATSIGTATLNADGNAATSIVSFQAGTHSITAVYSGNSQFALSTSAPYSLVVNPDPTVTVLSAAPNPAQFGAPVLFNAAVSAVAIPAGTVTFYDGPTAIGTTTVDANGNAGFTTSSLSVGTHAITASFTGSTNFGPSLSAVVNEVILSYTGSFSITLTPKTANLYTGESAQFATTLTPAGGWNGDVTLSCSQLPINTTCTFGTATITNGSGTTSLIIQTAAPQHANAIPSNHFPWLSGTGAGLALALIIIPRRLRRSRFLWTTVLLAVMGGVTEMITGCGAGPVTGGTPPGAYNVTVNATYSAGGQPVVVQTATIVLNVKTLF